MRRLLQFTIIASIAIMAVGIASAQGVTGTTTPDDGDGGSADDGSCDEPTCGSGVGGAGGTGGEHAECIHDVDGNQNQSLADWGFCEETNMGSLLWAHFYDTPFEGLPTLEIGMSTGVDLPGICSYDNIDGIQGWTLTLDVPNRMAKYKKLDAPTAPGTVWFKINDTVISVSYSSGFWTQSTFNDHLITQIEAAGFEVLESKNYVRIKRPFAPHGITQFTMRLQNVGDLKELAVALEPINWDSENLVDELLCRYSGN